MARSRGKQKLWTEDEDERLVGFLKKRDAGGSGFTLARAAKQMGRSRSSIANRWTHLKATRGLARLPVRGRKGVKKAAGGKKATKKATRRDVERLLDVPPSPQLFPFRKQLPPSSQDSFASAVASPRAPRVMFLIGSKEVLSYEVEMGEWARLLALVSQNADA